MRGRLRLDEMGGSLKRIMVQIPEKFLREFDKEIQGLYASRNEAIRAGMLLVLDYLKQRRGAVKV